ncbi:aromatic-ring-hydroxylating dioxygenase subunit beta [Metapseudomonas furukawaii]|uniref:aromatic-ring-hydroxylating dioxygenase subunit beta n=2 Tax=Gammaproteobacteria TaxID=1236 RepID=UPI00227A2B4B|nr:aromatic-ring-hydroxylating dioxygenase subunit beta [Pseudomonas furukawaii]WAG81556.1 aromatic-ring-hydroxylating dioxygenase subunit beta [Pseudomonas furukawaii]
MTSTATVNKTLEQGAPRSSVAGSAFRTVDVATQHAVEQFLYAEAQLLDDHRYIEWIELFTEDVRYWLPTRMTKTNRERHLEIANEQQAAFIDDSYFYLKGRVRRLTSGISWSEEPPSRTRRLITNIRVTPIDNGELAVSSNFYVYRSRLERHQDWFVGERYDVLRPADLEATGYPFQIAKRKIVLEQTTLLSPSLSVLL